MALFSKTKKDTVDDVATTADTKVSTKKDQKATIVTSGTVDLASVLLRPRITEKATDNMENGVYVFDVSLRSNKKQIAAAIKQVYNVTPVKINITQISKKNTMERRTGIKGRKGGGKKAYVFLKKGETISIM